MPFTQVLIILFVSTAGSWLSACLFIRFLFNPAKAKKIAGIKLQGILPASQAVLANEIAAFVNKHFLSPEFVTEKIVSPALLQKLQPEIEIHIDHFLKEKLSVAFPLLSKFMGEKTLSRFKEAFLAEVEILFPALLKNYTASLIQQLNPEKMIAQKINNISIPAIEKIILARASKQIYSVKLAAAVFGLLTGTVQVLIIICLNKV